jgi:hypothetical protein
VDNAERELGKEKLPIHSLSRAPQAERGFNPPTRASSRGDSALRPRLASPGKTFTLLLGSDGGYWSCAFHKDAFPCAPRPRRQSCRSHGLALGRRAMDLCSWARTEDLVRVRRKESALRPVKPGESFPGFSLAEDGLQSPGISHRPPFRQPCEGRGFQIHPAGIECHSPDSLSNVLELSPIFRGKIASEQRVCFSMSIKVLKQIS